MACAARSGPSLSALPLPSATHRTGAFPRCSLAGAAGSARFARAAPSDSACTLLCSVDVDAQRPLAKSFGVGSVPFVTLLQPGAWFAWDDAADEPVPLPATRFEGALAADAVAAWLNNRRVTSACCDVAAAPDCEPQHGAVGAPAGARGGAHSRIAARGAARHRERRAG